MVYDIFLDLESLIRTNMSLFVSEELGRVQTLWLTPASLPCSCSHWWWWWNAWRQTAPPSLLSTERSWTWSAAGSPLSSPWPCEETAGEEKERHQSVLLQGMIYVAGRGWAPPVRAADLVLHHSKSNSTDESAVEMNGDGRAVMHEAGGLGPVHVRLFANASTTPQTEATGHFYIIN